ncbi:MAG: hypothetical protein Q8K34_19660, partial [Hydrogenophaga sp.]|nr:hypothetical protein [Hydrogenophaga sp.]
HAQSQQVLDFGARPAPLFPVAHAHAPSDPLVQFRDWPVILADAKVRHPTPKTLPQFSQPVTLLFMSPIQFPHRGLSPKKFATMLGTLKSFMADTAARP